MKQNKLFEKVKKFKTVGLIVSVLFIILGILLFVPATTKLTVLFTSWFLIAAMAIAGVYHIVDYIATKKEMRKGWDLAQGIICLILVLLLVVCACLNGAEGFAASSLLLFEWICIFLGIYTLFAGIFRISASGQFENATFAVILGIIQIIVGSVLSFGFWFCWDPASLYTVICFLAAYLVIIGIVFGLGLLLVPNKIKERAEEIKSDVIDSDDDTIQ